MRVSAVALALAVAVAAPMVARGAQQGDQPETPKDSVKVVVTGCVKDKLLRASEIDTPDAENAAPIQRFVFRFSGKKSVTDPLKRLDGHKVNVTGYLRKIDLEEPGIRVGGGRVVLGAPPMDPRRPPLPDTTDKPVVLEVIGYEELAGTCR
jgi:hypothetical protein